MGVDAPKLGLDSVETKQIPKQNTSPEAIKKVQESRENTTSLVLECVDAVADNCSDTLTEGDKKNISASFKQLTKNELGIMLQDIKSSVEKFSIQDLYELLGIEKERQKKEETKQEIDKTEQEKEEIKQEIDKTEQEKKETKQEIDKTEQEKKETKQEIDKTEQEIDKTNQEKDKLEQNLTKLKNLTSGLERGKSYDFVLEFLDKKNPPEKEFKAVFSRLKTSPQVLKDISDDFYQKSPEKYAEFRNTLISIDSDFGVLLPSVETKKTLELTQLGIDDKNLNIQHIGDSIIAIKGDKKISIDGNGKRSISFGNSDYKLNSLLDNKKDLENIEKDNKKFEIELKSIDKEIVVGQKLQKNFSQTIDYLETMDSEKQDKVLEEFKNYIKINFPNNPEYLNFKNIEDLKNIKQKIENNLKKQQEEKAKKINEQEEKIKQILEDNVKKAEKIDKNKITTLQFLHKIGFDLIPQEMTDQIIKQVNKDKAKFGFKNDIDLANGNLGIDLDGDKNNMSLPEQKLFVKFTNKMISGSEYVPNYLTNSGDIIFVKTKKEFENTKQKENKYILNKTFSSEELTKIKGIIKNLDLKVEGELDMEKLKKIKNELKGEKRLTNKLYQRNQFGAEIETKINNFFEQQKKPKNTKEEKQQMITQDNSKKEIFIRSKIKGVSVGKISANLGLNN